MNDIAAAQDIDPEISKVKKWIELGEKPKSGCLEGCSSAVRTLVSRWKMLSIDGTGVLIRTVDSGYKVNVRQIVLPEVLRSEVLHQLHDLRVVGHLGIHRTIDRVRSRYYWPGLAQDVARWCAKCPQCSGRKGKPFPHKKPMSTFDTGLPFDRIAIDILDTHKVTRNGFRYVLVVSDYFTKWTDAFPLRRHTARIVAEVLVNRWVVYHGVPRELLSDQGAEFESALFKRMMRLLEIKKIRTSPYRPQTDGQVERFNRTLLNMLSAFVSDAGTDWDAHLSFVMMAYRTSVNASTGCTPQAMVYGEECNLPVDLIYDTIRREVPACPPDYVEYIRQSLQSAHAFAREHLKAAALRRKRHYDRSTRKADPYVIGDLVRYYYQPVRQQSKFGRPWTGPWRIVDRKYESDYLIELVSNPKKRRTVHFDMLKLYETQPAPVVTTKAYASEEEEREQDGILQDLREMLSPWEDAVNLPSASSSSEQSSAPSAPKPQRGSVSASASSMHRRKRYTRGRPPIQADSSSESETEEEGRRNLRRRSKLRKPNRYLSDN